MTELSPNRYLALPPSGKGPGVLVLHAWWGMNDFIRDFCDRLALEGFVALAPDLFAGQVARTVEEAERLTSQLNEEADIPSRLMLAVNALCSHPAVTRKDLGLVGFSFGAYWSLWLAQQQPAAFRAVTVFYGTDGGSLSFQQSTAAFQGHFAEADPYEPLSGVQELEKNLQAASRPVTFYTYPGTGHWFFEKDRQGAYEPQAAQVAWQRTKDFLHEQLGGAAA